MVRLVLDTGVFFRPKALRQLTEIDEPVVVPATVYMERGRQLLARGVTQAEWDEALDLLNVLVEPFERQHASRFGMRIADDNLWRRLYRDAMIAGHVEAEDVLWTTNPKDFVALGLKPEQVVTV